jgi:hypothetical protein
MAVEGSEHEDMKSIQIILCEYQGETETAKKAGTSEKDGVLSKNTVFSMNFPIFH